MIHLTQDLVRNTDLLVGYSTIGLFIVTTVLVLVTAYYAIQTRNTVKEMKRATEIQFLPSPIATFKGVSSGGCLTFRIYNVGRGPAIENKIKPSVQEIPTVNEEQDIQLLQTTEDKIILFNAGYTLPPDVNSENTKEHYMNNQRTVILRLDYKNIFDTNYHKDLKFDITNELKRSQQK